MIEVDITSDGEFVAPAQPIATTGLYNELIAKLKEKHLYIEDTSESEVNKTATSVDTSASTIILQDIRKNR
jgi:hypothetical protein